MIDDVRIRQMVCRIRFEYKLQFMVGIYPPYGADG